MSSKKSKQTALKTAIDRSAEFHGYYPRRVLKVNVEWPRALMMLGLCAQVDYVSDKFDDKIRRYFHEFELSDPAKPCLLLADAQPQPDGSHLLIIKGHFKIKPEGIVG